MSAGTAPRASCALQGALRTAGAVAGVVPVVHSTAGCSLQAYLSGCLAAGAQGGGRWGGLSTPSTNVGEKHVIFGGSSRLREQLKNTVRVADGDLYLVLSGCAPDLVGDDSLAMTRELVDQGYRATYLQASGFLGSAHLGHRSVVLALLDAVAEAAAAGPTEMEPEPPAVGPEPPTVNLFGVVPGQDSFWQGDLRGLTEALAAVGLRANPLFGPGRSFADWRRVPQAQLNLAISPWGEEQARHAQRLFGTPWLIWPYLPVGADDTAALLAEVLRTLPSEQGISERRAERLGRVSAATGSELVHHLGQFADAYFEFGLQSDVVLVGPTAQTLGLARFLTTVLGFTPRGLVLTDLRSVAGAEGEGVRRVLAEVGLEVSLGDRAPQEEPSSGVTLVLAGEDTEVIGEFIESLRPQLVLGSSLEEPAARRIGAGHLPVSFPVHDRLVLDRSYAGFCGTSVLLEDLGTALLAARRRTSDPGRVPEAFDHGGARAGAVPGE